LCLCLRIRSDSKAFQSGEIVVDNEVVDEIVVDNEVVDEIVVDNEVFDGVTGLVSIITNDCNSVLDCDDEDDDDDDNSDRLSSRVG
jgi:hypothetical protein